MRLALAASTIALSVNTRSAIGLVGVILLVIGVFTPIVGFPLVGSVTYFGNGHGDGVFVLALAAISLVLILARKYRWLWLTGAASLALLAVAFFDFRSRMAAPDKQLVRDAALQGQAVRPAHFEWGWAVLVAGTALLLVCAALREKRASP